MAQAIQAELSTVALRRELLIPTDAQGRLLTEVRRGFIDVESNSRQDRTAFGVWADEAKAAGMASWIGRRRPASPRRPLTPRGDRLARSQGRPRRVS